MRRTPLRRVTGLARGESQLKRTPLERRTRLNPRSRKRKAIAQERREFVQRILRERPWCQACTVIDGLAQPLPATDVHEIVRRSQGSPIVPSQGLRDEDVWAVCRICHDWIGLHPERAVKLGLARWGMRPNPGSDRPGTRVT